MITAKATWRRNPSGDSTGMTVASDNLIDRRDGKFEERFGNGWTAEYSEHPATGLWQVEIFRHDVCEWHGIDYESLEEARQVAQDHYAQV